MRARVLVEFKDRTGTHHVDSFVDLDDYLAAERLEKVGIVALVRDEHGIPTLPDRPGQLPEEVKTPARRRRATSKES